MEEGIRRIREVFGIEIEEAAQYSPLVLAYIGDAVYETVIRSLALSEGNRQVEKLHRYSAGFVRASAQADLGRYLLPLMSEEEADIYRRGRNAHSHTVAKNASIGDYRHATGFEALIGYLYLKGEERRALELIRIGLEGLEKKS
ncbi:MAG: ribonuclease III domain-containing protein [Johnsonella sp.]|nr:ribonuclease III domain-containing protein [Johnsonella sp.]